IRRQRECEADRKAEANSESRVCRRETVARLNPATSLILRTSAFKMKRATSGEPTCPANARQASGGAAACRRLDIRAEVGWFPRARLSGRRRDPHSKPG